MALKGTKKVSHSSLGRDVRKGPAGRPHGSMGGPIQTPDNTHGATPKRYEGGPQAKTPAKNRSWLEDPYTKGKR